MGELLERYYRITEDPIEVEIQASEDETEIELRQPDMFYLATNFDIIFDPSVTFGPDGDEELYRLALDMRETEPGDLLGYMRKWIAFQQRFNEALPMLPVYTNVYFDFYIDGLHGYNIDEVSTWSDALVGANVGEMADAEIGAVAPAAEEIEIIDG